MNNKESLLPVKSSKILPVQKNDNYQYIMNELNSSSIAGDIYGDDSVVWGNNLGPYYNTSETYEKLKSAEQNFPDVVHFFEYGVSYQNKPLFGVRISAPTPTQVYQRFDSILIGAHHAREAITVMDTLIFMDTLLKNYVEGKKWATSLLSTTNLYVIPVFNPDGLDFLYKNPWQRKNMQPFDADGDGSILDEYEVQDANGDNYVHQGYLLEGIDSNDSDSTAGEDHPGGIDLNRNYPYEFNSASAFTNMNAQDFPGYSPLSAPETSNYAEYIADQHFLMSMSLHSGIQAIIHPWGYTDNPTPDEELFSQITKGLQNATDFPTWEEVGGYKVNGEWGDWMYGEHNSIAFTIETYRNSSGIKYDGSKQYGVFDFFNPNGEDILDTSNDGVQNHLRYFFNVPNTNLMNKNYNLSINKVINHDGKVSISIRLDNILGNKQISLEKINQKYQNWTQLKTASAKNGTITLTVNENEYFNESLRIFVGEKSRGWSTYFSINASESNYISTSPTTGSKTNSDFVHFQFSLISYIILIPIINKFLTKKIFLRNSE